MAGQDEQGVVDADAETHHHRHDGGDLRHREDAGEQPDRAEADEQPDQRDHDRQAHRDQGAERDGQHDDRDQDAELLAAGRSVTGGEAEALVVLDLDARVAGDLDGLLGGREVLGADLLGVERHGGEGGGAVLAHGGTTRVVGISDVDDVLALGQLGHGLLDGGLGGGLGEAVLVVEDDVGGVERLLREAGLDGVGRTLRLGTREAEALVGSTADGRVEHERSHGDEYPGREDAPRVATGEVADPVENARHGGTFLAMGG